MPDAVRILRIVRRVVMATALFALHAQPANAWDCAHAGAASPLAPAAVATDWWQAEFRGEVELARLQPPEIVLLGDSLFERWPAEALKTAFAPHKVVNFGVHSDKVENLLWRFQNASAAVWGAKVFVILIGTNDLSMGTPPLAIANGVSTLINTIQGHAPQSAIVVVGLLPREKGTNGWVRKAVQETNLYLRQCGQVSGVDYVQLNALLEDDQGNLNAGMASDQLHLTATGYGLISPPLADAVRKLLSR